MCKRLFYLLFLILWLASSSAQDLNEIISLPNGKIRGHLTTTFQNTNYLAFQEIPYAAPPIGELRFKDPVPPNDWEGILNTTENTKICYQTSHKARENEDCLYLNIYAPLDDNLQMLKDLPVLFFIHGGAFQNEDGTFESFGPEFYIVQNIVVVTINYRLGAFGFLSTQDSVVPGNQGLKDQNLALTWVNTNIHLFGGDPSKITINGQSAGAAGVGFQLISEKSKGLFRAAILESSTALCSWAYQRRAKEIAYQLATAIDSSFTTNNSSEDTLKLLQSTPAANIRDANIPGFNLGIQIGQGNIWAPVIESKDDGNSFITEPMHERIQNGNISKVPLLIGVNSEERITMAKNLESFKKQMAKFDKNVSLLVNEDYNIKESDVVEVGKKIRGIYTDSAFEEHLGAAIEFHSDVRYTTAVARHADLHSQYADVFFYEFSYDGEMGHRYNIHLDDAYTVGHHAEIYYLWSSEDSRNTSQYPSMDVIIHDRLVKLWTNFVKYLDPTPEDDDLLENVKWPTVDPSNFRYLNINSTLVVQSDPKAYKEWKAIIDTYGNPPFYTY